MRIEAQSQPREKLLRELPKGPTYDTARHEVMHGLIDAYAVIGISSKAEGNTLGWTLMTNVGDTARAAGIVHGKGSSHDEAMIRLNALQNGTHPDTAVSIAVASARAILTGKDGLIDLMARELAQKGTMSGSEFRNLLSRAQNEINSKREEPFDWTALFGEKPEENQEGVVINDKDPYNLIPKEGKAELTVYTENGFSIKKYEDGVVIEEEQWILVEEEEGNKKYIKKSDSSLSKPEFTDVFTLPPQESLPRSGRIFTFPLSTSSQETEKSA